MRIVCLGDSLTFGYGVPRACTWSFLARTELGAEWSNRGVCGDTTGGMLVRLQSCLDKKPDAMIIMGGTNDLLIGGAIELPKANIMAMAHQCANAGVLPIIGIPIPIADVNANPWTEIASTHAMPDYLEYIQWLRGFSKVFGFKTLDFYAAFEREAARGTAAALYLDDGLHPNGAGHRLMANTVIDSGIFYTDY